MRMELQIPMWCNKNGRILISPFNVMPSGFTLLCLVKLLCLAHKSSNGLHHISIPLDVDTVELSKTIENLDIHWSLGSWHILNYLDLLEI
jgi:hypothetical protein